MTNAFYLPGVNPKNYKKGEEVKLKVNSMTSVKTHSPVEYYRLPFCKPENGPKRDNENLGEFLAGDRIESSPFKLIMKEDMYCEQVCISNLGRAESDSTSPNKVIRAIKRDYHNNWIVDNLPSASKLEDETDTYTKYWQGFPIGFIASDDGKAYINNHVNLEIEYHTVQDQGEERYRVVRFTVEPFSIKHDYTPQVVDDDGDATNTVADISNPILSCDPKAKTKKHTNFYMATHNGHMAQEASGRVLFTYDVQWIENEELHWASRWDVYLSMNDGIPSKVHWLSIANSLIIVFVLTAMIAAILVRNLRRDYDRYAKVPTDEERAEDLEEFGWKLVHADVFRVPSHPMLLSVLCGSGVQLLGMAFLTILFAAMGFLSPANRGSLLMALVLLYVLMGSVNGFVTAKMYKTFKGKSWQKATTVSAFGFPGLVFATFFFMDMLAITQESSDAVPFTTMLTVLVLWFGISTPLVYFGAFMGFKHDPIDFPVNTSNIPRQIPDQPWFMSTTFTALLGGIMPFGACFLELFFIMSSLWMDQYYYVFGFLLLTFTILLVTCAEITILFNYFQLCGEDYNWWWRSFSTAAACALYVYGYSFHYFSQLESSSSATYILYFGYMTLICIALGIMTGSVGLFSTLYFNRTIYSYIKVE